MTGPEPTPSSTQAARQALYLVPRLNRWVQARVLQRDLGGDLSLRQLTALFLIREESTTLGEIARRLMVTPAVITGLIDRLEKRGYVRRVNEPGDRRRIHLALTDDGRAASIAVENALVDELAAVLGQFSDEELQSICHGLGLLDHVIRDLEARHATQRVGV